MNPALAALASILIAVAVICAGIWWAHKPLDADYARPAREVDIPFLAAVLWGTRDEDDDEIAQAIRIGNGPAFEQTLAEIRMLPEVS